MGSPEPTATTSPERNSPATRRARRRSSILSSLDMLLTYSCREHWVETCQLDSLHDPINEYPRGYNYLRVKATRLINLVYLDNTEFVGIPKDIVGIKLTWDQDDDTWKKDVVDKVIFKLMERLD